MTTFTPAEIADLAAFDAAVDRADARKRTPKPGVDWPARVPRGDRHTGDPVLAGRVGVLVRARRLAVGWGMRDLAAALGISWSTISRIEAGIRLPSVPLLVDLAIALDCSPGELLPTRDEIAEIPPEATGSSVGHD